jgi:hypothetical protein
VDSHNEQHRRNEGERPERIERQAVPDVTVHEGDPRSSQPASGARQPGQQAEWAQNGRVIEGAVWDEQGGQDRESGDESGGDWAERAARPGLAVQLSSSS